MRIDWNSHDRLLIALFAASVIHAMLILGLNFQMPKPSPAAKALDIVLVQNPTAHTPEKADFHAADNQLGSGTGKEKAMPKAAPPLPQGAGEQMLNPQLAPNPAPEARPKPRTKLTQRQAEKKILADTGEDDPEPTESHTLSAEALRQVIAEFSAEFAASEDSQAKQPKIVPINAVSAQRYKAAAYELAWQMKVERIGNLNYPDEARRKKLSGSLTLAVAVKPDGSVFDIKVQESSGKPVLDQAAERIVRLAAPFAPFPMELQQEADVLVITRTWRFSIDHRMETKQ